MTSCDKSRGPLYLGLTPMAIFVRLLQSRFKGILDYIFVVNVLWPLRIRRGGLTTPTLRSALSADYSLRRGGWPKRLYELYKLYNFLLLHRHCVSHAAVHHHQAEPVFAIARVGDFFRNTFTVSIIQQLVII